MRFPGSRPINICMTVEAYIVGSMHTCRRSILDRGEDILSASALLSSRAILNS